MNEWMNEWPLDRIAPSQTRTGPYGTDTHDGGSHLGLSWGQWGNFNSSLYLSCERTHSETDLQSGCCRSGDVGGREVGEWWYRYREVREGGIKNMKAGKWNGPVGLVPRTIWMHVVDGGMNQCLSTAWFWIMPLSLSLSLSLVCLCMPHHASCYLGQPAGTGHSAPGRQSGEARGRLLNSWRPILRSWVVLRHQDTKLIGGADRSMNWTGENRPLLN